MAIRFRCRRCAVLLSIGARKAGSEIRCPRCGAAQTVPNAENKPEQRAIAAPTPARSATAGEAIVGGATDSAAKGPASSATTAAALNPTEGDSSPVPISSTIASQPAASLAPAEIIPSGNGSGTATTEADNEPPGVIIVYDYEDAYEPADEEIASEVAGNPLPSQNPLAATAASSLTDTAEFTPPWLAGGSSAERVFSEQPPRLGGGKGSESSPQAASGERRSGANSSESAATAAAPVRQSSPGERSGAAAAAVADETVSDEMVYLPRRIVFAQAWFLLATCGVAFAAGYWIGGGRPSGSPPGDGQPEAQTRVFVEGLVAWTPMPGQTAGDESAVVILLPADRPPEPPIPMSGLRPVDPMPGELHRGLRAIKKAGGDYTRADAEGRFGLVAPIQGRYRILIISRHAGRVENAIVQEADFNEIGRYLQSPEMLVGRYKYQWRTEEVRAGFAPLEISFGQDGKN